MQYIIVEIQTMKNGEMETTAVVPPVVYDNYNQAEAKFHTVLAAAAVVAPVPPLEIGTAAESFAGASAPESVVAVSVPDTLASPTTSRAASGVGVLIPTFCFRRATSGVPCGIT